MSDVDWNEQNTATLKKMWDAGYPYSQIAAQIPYATRSAIAGKIMRLKLPAPDRKNSPQARRFPRSHSTPSSAAQPRLRTRPGKIVSLSRFPAETNPARREGLASEPDLPQLPLKGEAPNGTGIKFLELTSVTCHWPRGDPLEPDFEFCGGKALTGMPYCAGHCRLAFTPATERRREMPRN